ncbi:hypothetical protein [Flagellimonas sp.]|uniref:hypothetical protein n=1 Tax=Flagellimonas sp. TaxID=2058762 RepID=UPI003BAB6D3A
MKFKKTAPKKVLLFLSILIFSISCSKDSDLLQEYILSDSTDTEEVIDDIVDNENDESINSGNNDIVDGNNTDKDDSGPLKAFPSAEGFGKNATGGRGGDLYYVTNLNSDGPGSLQYGLSTTPSSGRTILFKVSGWIDHGGSDYLVLNKPNITIAGETAPGGGIGIRGELRIQNDNVIVRHISVRNDDGWSGSNQAAVRIAAYNGESTEDIILDHVSLGWASDENLTVTSTSNTGYVNRVTVQNCIIDNNLNTGYNAINYWNVTNFTYFQNLFGYSTDRNPQSTTCGAGSMEVINNMIYSYTQGAFIASWGIDFDVIGNHYDTGGNSLPWGDAVVQMNDPRVQNCEELGKTDLGLEATRLYYEDNLFNNGPADYDSYSKSRLQSAPQVSSGIIAYPATQTRNNVLTNAGAYNGLQQGLNSYDRDLINKVQNDLQGTRLTSRIYPLDFPTLGQGVPYVDTDNDGMEDQWEIKNFGDLQQFHNGDYDNDGYTNIEEFLHYLAE